MDWKEVRIHTTNEAMEPISNILNECGANGVVIEDPLELTKEKETLFGEIYELNSDKYPLEGIYVKAYFLNDEQFPKIVKQIKARIINLQQFNIDLGRNEVIVSSVDEEDWSTSWKKYYKPTSVSDKITIVPSWEHYEHEADDELVVKLDPGMAFGTGTHPTTILSIRALEKYITREDMVIDVGCGSGVLSIASVLLGAGHAYAFDLDQVAVNSTKINSELNNIEDKITVQKNNLLENVKASTNIVVSNILAEILVNLMHDARHCLVDDGIFILSGIIDKKEKMIKENLEQHGFKIIDRNKIDHWVSFVAQKEHE